MLIIADALLYNAVIKLVNCRQVSWLNPKVIATSKPLLYVEGARTSGIDIGGSKGLIQDNLISSSESVPAGGIMVR